MNIEKITAAAAKFSFTVKVEGVVVKIVNPKGQLAAQICNGKVEPKYAGQKVLCGSLLRNALAEAIKEEVAL